MNTETTQDNSATPSTGERLRSAREQMGLTQQNVAERLCLKLSTVRDIEEDRPPASLALTFLRGYIRSYARLVHVPEEELLPELVKQVPMRRGKVEPPMQSFSRGRRRKKSDRWLMIFTWLVVLVVISLTGAWWWQNHKAARNDLISLGQQNSADSVDNTLSLAQTDNGASDTHSVPVPAEHSSAADTPVTDNAAPAIPTTLPAPQVAASQSAASSPAPVDNQASTDNQQVASDADTSTPPGDPNAIVLDFTNDCWLEVTDAAGKKLFSGMQHNGGKLSLAGTAPYRLKIGAPAAVQIQFQGQPVDLSHFIRTNQVARLTLGAR